MTQYDVLLAELARGVSSLTKRFQVVLFSACCNALLPAYSSWARQSGHAGQALLVRAMAVAREYAIEGVEPAGSARLLAELQEATPSGESTNHLSSTYAQDCWICADVSIRTIVQREYEPGSAIEYVLEPIISSVSERLFGVSQVGSGEHEEEQIADVLDHPAMVKAIEFVRWALTYLSQRDELAVDDIKVIELRATVLAPQG